MLDRLRTDRDAIYLPRSPRSETHTHARRPSAEEEDEAAGSGVGGGASLVDPSSAAGGGAGGAGMRTRPSTEEKSASPATRARTLARSRRPTAGWTGALDESMMQHAISRSAAPRRP